MSQETNLNKDARIKVCLVDDEELYREGIKVALSADTRISLYGEYESATQFIRSFNSPFEPDVCLIDICLPEMSGVECAKKVKEKNPAIHVILMTAYPSFETLSEAKDIGADYIEKGTRGEILIDKIVANAKSPKKEQLISLHGNHDEINSNILLLTKKFESIQKNVSKLSDHQKRVLKLRQNGKSIKEISQILDITPNTVRTHINRASKKLEISKLLDFIEL